jgi:hypothetical protein
MTTRIERPVFFESQILGAADLTGGVEYHRGQAARHNRYLHLWGIADGLIAEATKASDGGDYVDIWIEPGMAIDSSGREIVLTERTKLDENDFTRLQVVLPDPDAYYPVFLVGRDEPAPIQPFSIGACNTSQPTRKLEGIEITYGRPIEAQDLDAQLPSVISDGPANRASRVLLGYVQWNSTLSKFKSWSDESLGVGRRYAGVKADVVSARGKSLVLMAEGDSPSTKPAIGLGGKDPNVMFGFGVLTEQGSVKPLFSISPKGDVRAEGTISGAVKPDTVQIQSGVISDGVTVPLPPGITEEQVTGGKVTLHIQLTPTAPGGLAPSNAANWISSPLECGLDGTTRRVLCRFRWFRPGGATVIDLPGTCNYVVIASVASAEGV